MKLTDMLIVLISITTSYGYWSFGVYIFDAKINDPSYFWITLSTLFVVLLPAGAFSSLLFDYIGVVKRMFKLNIEHIIKQYSEIVYSINNHSATLIPKMKHVTEDFYEYHCGYKHLRLNKEKAESFFLDPMKPSINELTMFELCGYNDCIQTFGEPYDYSKSFDELFGYYMQQGFINKIKYVIKNRDRF